jgi:hypothetical protein
MLHHLIYTPKQVHHMPRLLINTPTDAPHAAPPYPYPRTTAPYAASPYQTLLTATSPQYYYHPNP